MSAHVVTMRVRARNGIYDVKLAVDFDHCIAAAKLAVRAVNNKSRIAKECGGAVSVEVLEMQQVIL